MSCTDLYNPDPRERTFHQVWDETVAPPPQLLSLSSAAFEVEREESLWAKLRSHIKMICLTGKERAWDQVSNPPPKLYSSILKGKTCMFVDGAAQSGNQLKIKHGLLVEILGQLNEYFDCSDILHGHTTDGRCCLSSVTSDTIPDSSRPKALPLVSLVMWMTWSACQTDGTLSALSWFLFRCELKIRHNMSNNFTNRHQLLTEISWTIIYVFKFGNNHLNALRIWSLAWILYTAILLTQSWRPLSSF